MAGLMPCSGAWRTTPLIGTITPFSNNATICSVPGLHSRLAGARARRALNASPARCAIRAAAIDLPTGVGFCMLIDRTLAGAKGSGFDVESFPRGCGRRTTCARRSAGFAMLCPNVYVAHRGWCQSFSEATQALMRERAPRRLLAKHPGYDRRSGRMDRRRSSTGARESAPSAAAAARRSPRRAQLAGMKPSASANSRATNGCGSSMTFTDADEAQRNCAVPWRWRRSRRPRRCHRASVMMRPLSLNCIVRRPALSQRVRPVVPSSTSTHFVRRAVHRLADDALRLLQARPSGGAASAGGPPCPHITTSGCRALFARRSPRRTSPLPGHPPACWITVTFAAFAPRIASCSRAASRGSSVSPAASRTPPRPAAAGVMPACRCWSSCRRR